MKERILAAHWAVGLLLGAAALWRGMPETMRARVTPRRLLETAVRLETGAESAQTAPEPETISAPAPTPAPVPEDTPSPLPAIPDDSAPDHTPEGLPILPTSFPGGLTMKNETDFNPDLHALLESGPGLTLPADGPQVLIVHTHTSEAYTPSDGCRYEASDTMRTQDPSYSILRVGDVLTAKLEAAGLTVLHDRTVNDYPSYAGSYGRSGAAVRSALEANPSIRVVIDLHRDALCSDDVVYKTVAELPDAQPCAQVMLLIGTNGTGLEHPDWERNLALAVWLQDAVTRRHPTLMRPITLVNERYNQHLSPGMLLIEVGSSGNTLPEALRAAELFGEAMGDALAGRIE